jgi:fatty-acyl-CoA synthase
VEEVVNRFPSIQEAVVYGVAIPGKDGKAGMASVSVALGADFDSPAFYKQYVLY